MTATHEVRSTDDATIIEELIEGAASDLRTKPQTDHHALTDQVLTRYAEATAGRHAEAIEHALGHLANVEMHRYISVICCLDETDSGSYATTSAMAELLLARVRAQNVERQALHELVADRISVAADTLLPSTSRATTRRRRINDMAITGRTYLDPGDRLAGRYNPPRPCQILTQWGPGGGPRNVRVRYHDTGTVAVIPFARRLRRPAAGGQP